MLQNPQSGVGEPENTIKIQGFRASLAKQDMGCCAKNVHFWKSYFFTTAFSQGPYKRAGSSSRFLASTVALFKHRKEETGEQQLFFDNIKIGVSEPLLDCWTWEAVVQIKRLLKWVNFTSFSVVWLFWWWLLLSGVVLGFIDIFGWRGVLVIQEDTQYSLRTWWYSLLWFLFLLLFLLLLLFVIIVILIVFIFMLLLLLLCLSCLGYYLFISWGCCWRCWPCCCHCWHCCSVVAIVIVVVLYFVSMLSCCVVLLLWLLLFCLCCRFFSMSLKSLSLECLKWATITFVGFPFALVPVVVLLWYCCYVVAFMTTLLFPVIVIIMLLILIILVVVVLMLLQVLFLVLVVVVVVVVVDVVVMVWCHCCRCCCHCCYAVMLLLSFGLSAGARSVTLKIGNIRRGEKSEKRRKMKGWGWTNS